MASTSRKADSEAALRALGVDRFFLDDGENAGRVKREWDGGADKVLELVPTTTLRDSLRSTREPAVVCMTGMVGNRWSIGDCSPMEAIPTAVGLTVYDGGVKNFVATPVQRLIEQVTTGTLPVSVGQVFHLDQIVDARRTMEENRARGKILVLTR